MKRLLLGLAVLSAVVAALAPPRQLRIAPTKTDPPPAVRGVMHVHTTRSDGTGTPDDVALAASRAGLQFVIFTDHGDGTRPPDPPQYRHGVLCLDAVEVSTNEGHIVALGLPRMGFRLGGRSGDALEDIARVGGFAVLAHPASPRPGLAWLGGLDGFGGLEWLNGDSEWRDESVPSLVSALLTYWIRPTESLTALLDRPAAAFELWDKAQRLRPVVALAGADAHARAGLRGVGEPYDSRPVAKIPGYEWLFRAFSLSLPGVRLQGDAGMDGAAVERAIRAGHVVSVTDGLAAGGWLDFTARSGRFSGAAGDVLPLDGAVSLLIRTPSEPGVSVRVLRDGQEIAFEPGGTVGVSQDASPHIYRVEAYLAGARPPAVPWMVSNSIYVGHMTNAEPEDEGPGRPLIDRRVLADEPNADAWTVEKTAGSDGRVDLTRSTTGGRQWHMRFALGGRRADHPYVAAAYPIAGIAAGTDAVEFTVRTTAPMRVWVQLRSPGGDGQGRRWGRSVYASDTPRTVRLRLSDLAPLGHTVALTPSEVRALLFVVDDLHTPLGTGGQFWVDDIAVGTLDTRARVPVLR